MLLVWILGLVWFILAIITEYTGGDTVAFWVLLGMANVCWAGVLLGQAVIRELRRTVKSEEER